VEDEVNGQSDGVRIRQAQMFSEAARAIEGEPYRRVLANGEAAPPVGTAYARMFNSDMERIPFGVGMGSTMGRGEGDLQNGVVTVDRGTDGQEGGERGDENSEGPPSLVTLDDEESEGP
jgi:hypothetical protein